jgi:hypothetical protein
MVWWINNQVREQIYLAWPDMTLNIHNFTCKYLYQVHLNGVLNESLLSLCLCVRVSLSLLSKLLVEKLLRHRIRTKDQNNCWKRLIKGKLRNNNNSVAWVRKRTILTERPPFVGEVNAKFTDRGCHVVSVTDSYGSILGFLDRSSYFSIK